jgi:hypothetical protein
MNTITKLFCARSLLMRASAWTAAIILAMMLFVIYARTQYPVVTVFGVSPAEAMKAIPKLAEWSLPGTATSVWAEHRLVPSDEYIIKIIVANEDEAAMWIFQQVWKRHLDRAISVRNIHSLSFKFEMPATNEDTEQWERYGKDGKREVLWFKRGERCILWYLIEEN